MDHRVLFVVATVASAFTLSAAAATPTPLFGFAPDETAVQRSIEQRFDAGLKTEDLDAWLKKLSSEANNVGAPHDKQNAEFVRDQFQSWGWDAQIEEFYPLYPTLKHHTLELVAPTRFVASLTEPPIAGDATSARTDGMGPYNVYGADGDVTGDLVYVNFGMPDDYKDLARHGVDVKGKIVITRYGGGWRGLKPKLAQTHGAIGCIIYSDPQQDGYGAGDVYPKGGTRPPDGVQRGSVADLPVLSGDPLTPGVGATKNAKRLEISEAKALMKIPVIPISYRDAQPLLAALGGPVVPSSWRGALPITYHMGPGPAKVHLEVTSEWGRKPLYDVIARIPGSQSPDQWIVRGNHRDGWVFGAWDPLSGHVDMMAEAKAIGALLKSGWRPKRTLIYASWDGEEAGLLGSTEWVETHADELRRKAVLYVNSDTNGRGFLGVQGSHSLQRLINDVSQSVQDPETHVTVGARLRARMLVDGHEKGASDRDRKDAQAAGGGGDLPIGALGSGSDFTPFLQHLGVASLAIEFGGEAEQAGVYHSNYDSYDHYVRFGDPGFAYGIAEAEAVGHTVLRVADANILPFQFASFADTLDGYLVELHELADHKRKDVVELNKLFDLNAFALADDPKHPVLAPEREAEVPYLDFAALDNAVVRLKKSAKAYDERYARLLANGTRLNAEHNRQLDELLRGMESTLTNPHGLPEREWYKHLIYEPGLYTGYGVKTVPGVREAIEQSHWDEANQYVRLTAAALNAYCERLEQASSLLGDGG